jgi:hypothetical protein
VDNVDVPAATRRGVLVVNSPEGNTIAAAEHALALMFALSRHVPQAHASMVAGGWDRKSYVGNELYKKVLGVVGLGKIGSHVARVARAAQVALVAQALQLGPVVQVSQPVRVVRPNKVVLGVRALVLANQRVEISLDQAIQVLDRHRKAMIGNRVGLQHMSPDWGLPSLRVVVVSEMSVFRG